MGFPRQEYRSGLSFPSPGHLSDSRIELTSPALAGGFFTVEHLGSPKFQLLKQNQKISFSVALAICQVVSGCM